MAVMRNSIIFGGVDSADYGIYIGGEGTFNAPKRDAEMISIPGRNGAFVLDKGRFENIEVKYSAFNYEPDLATFSANLDAFRNAICSQSGYQRLTDSFHPDEYRMATYNSGLEVKPVKYNTAAEFDIVFDCMPQRYLTSGEEAITVADGETITNPTRFDAKPMLEVEGYGTIAFNGYEIELDNAVMGEVELVSAKNWNSATWRPYLMPKEQEALYNSGDTLTLAKTIFEFSLSSSNYATSYLIASATASDNNALFSTEFVRVNGPYAYFKTTISPLTFTAGTYSTITDTVTINATMKDASTKTFTVSIYFSYEAVGTEYTDIHFGTSATLPQYYYDHFEGGRGGALTVNSTVSVLGHPTYIDCDLGEAYMIKDNVPISLDAYIDLGSDLPKLSPGNNIISFDDTITDLKIIPRWWGV